MGRASRICKLLFLFLTASAGFVTVLCHAQGTSDNLVNQYNMTRTYNTYPVPRSTTPTPGELRPQQDPARSASLQVKDTEHFTNLPQLPRGLSAQAIIENTQRALALREAAGDKVGRAVSHEELARLFIVRGKPEEALVHLGAAGAVAKGGDPKLSGDVFRSRAPVYMSLGKFQAAVADYSQAIKFFQELKDARGEAEVAINLGWAYQSMGEIPKTVWSYNRALKIYADLGDKDGQVRARMAAGSMYALVGEPTKALLQYRAAWNMASSHQRAWILASYSDILTANNEPAKALDYYNDARMLMSRPDRPYIDVSGAAIMGPSLPKLTLPEAIYQENLAMDPSFDAATLAGITRAELMLENFPIADPFADLALLKMRQARNRPGEADVLAISGELHFWQAIRTPDHDPWPQFKIALRDYSDALSVMREVGDRSGEIGVLTDTGMLYDAWKKRKEALSYYLQALDKLEELQTSARLEEFRINLAEQASALYQRAVVLQMSLHREEIAFNLSERARSRALLDQLGNPKIDLARHAPANFATKEEALRGENIALRRWLAEEMTKPVDEMDHDQIASIQSRLAVIHQQYEDLTTQLKLSNPEYASFLSVSPITIADLQAQLGPEVTLVSYYTTPSVDIAFVITQHEFRAVKLPATEARISAATATLLDFAGEQNSPSLTQLYKWLIAPIRSELKTPLLAIAPYGVLHDLPFAALTADGKRYLNDDYTIFLLPSASAWPYVQARTKPATGSHALIMANDQVIGQATLPHAYEEAQAVASLLGTAPKLGSDATGEVFKTTAGESEIVHLIGHIGSDKESPGFSEVAVGGNSTESPLQLNDILNLKLGKTNLVVLSGCQSNSGARSRADDVSSLSSAFLYAGTPSVIASLWNVDDASTKELMVAFYTHLKEGMGKAEALRAAQQDVRKNHPNPYYWAGFVLTGDPGTTPASALVARSNR